MAGLSLGGYVGIAAAERFPGRVAGLVAMGCTARSSSSLGAYRLAASLAARNPSLANRISAYGLRRLLPGPVGEAFVAGGLSCEVMPQVVEAVAGHDQLAALAAYPGRVWLVNGTRDPFRANESDFLRACQDGRLILIPRRGHLGVMADPGSLARLMGDCVTRWGGRGATAQSRRSSPKRAERSRRCDRAERPGRCELGGASGKT